MRRSQGRYFSSQEINRIKLLLSSTDMTLQEIAIRMSCAKSSIVAINQNFRIREYRGRRGYWAVASNPENASAEATPDTNGMESIITAATVSDAADSRRNR